MPRPPRIHVDNGFYHVLARGNNKDNVFLHPNDYQTYLSLLDKCGAEYGVLLHAYVLMPNHVHLIAQVGSTPLSAFMQKVQQTYTQEFNRRYSRVGHVFQGRYKALLIEDDPYLLALIRYIHYNPVRAGITETPEDYPWTSHHHYTAGNGPGRVYTAFVQELLASFGLKSIQEFDQLDSGTARDVETPARHPTPICLDNKNVETLLTSIVEAVARTTGVHPARITGSGRDRSTSRARQLLVYYAVRQANIPASILSRLLGCSSSAISLTTNKIAARLDSGDNDWHNALTMLERHLTELRE